MLSTKYTIVCSMSLPPKNADATYILYFNYGLIFNFYTFLFQLLNDTFDGFLCPFF